MSDKKEENIKPAPIKASKVHGGSELTSASTTEKLFPDIDHDPSMPEQSKGEKIFNWTVYSGLNYWTNLISSVIIADYFTNLPKGRQKLDKVINGMTKAFKSVGMAEEKAHHIGKVAAETSALTFGGWLLLIPLKIMEDHKRPIVHWINKKFGVEQKGLDGHELTPDEIYIEKEQPKQTWTRTVGRRFAAWGSVVGTGFALEHTLGKQNTTDFIVKHTNRALNSGYVPGGKWLASKDATQRYLSLAALDTIFTKVTAVVMHLTNGAKAEKMPNEVGDDKSPPAPQEANNADVQGRIGFEKRPRMADTQIPGDESFAQAISSGKAQERTAAAIAARGKPESFAAGTQQPGTGEISLGN